MSARPVKIPEAVRVACGLESIHYEDAFEVRSQNASAHSAEAWAREILANAPPTTRALINNGWVAAGLKARAEPFEQSLMSRIIKSSSDAIVLAAQSKLGMRVRVVVYVLESSVGMATFVRLDTRMAHVAWGLMAPGHRWFAPRLLTHAADRARKRL